MALLLQMRARIKIKLVTAACAALLSVVAAVNHPDPPFAFTSVSVIGTNLVLRAAMPAGLTGPALETRAGFDSAWQTVNVALTTMADGKLEFVLPKPGANIFLRLRASAVAGADRSESAAVSPSLSFCMISPLPLVTNRSGEVEAVLRFKGRVDGSDKMLLKRDGLFWEHINWGWPEGAVTVNEASWKPADQNYAAPGSNRPLLPPGFAFHSAKLEIIKARDVVALEHGADGLIIHMDDTPAGPDDYEFIVRFREARPKAVRKSTPATLKIVATIDGSDCLHLTANGARWEHFQWEAPTTVTLNDRAWNPAQDAALKIDKTNFLLPAGVDLSSARIVGRKGRALATLWATAEEVKVNFADNPNGSDTYELTIAFGE